MVEWKQHPQPKVAMVRELSKLFPRIEVIDSIEVIYEGKTHFVQWTDFYRADDIGKPKTFPSLLVVVDEEGNDFVPPKSNAVERDIKLLGIEKRITQLHEELGINPITDLDEIQKILNRVWSGEWMGQFEFGKSIHLDTLRKILNLELPEFWVLFDTLNREVMVDTTNGWFLYKPTR